ncbi:unnamed protein product [Fraxinus pennsylvanica]|uniref:Uncharacterized protein n=1 Tax=Fraxinus pennsylvanica TaxID=56036 RepID=A0AAD2E191_9LAMI|nr:unnamed protein product [Fraxinus pennsylvanica]
MLGQQSCTLRCHAVSHPVTILADASDSKIIVAKLDARKSAASKRSRPEFYLKTESSTQNSSTIIVEEALSNLEIDGGNMDNDIEELSIASLQRDGGSLFSRVKLLGNGGCCPLENLRAAADSLFLQGNSDLVVVKQAITESSTQNSSTLFVEEALSNLEIDGGNMDNDIEELSIASLQRDGGSL